MDIPISLTKEELISHINREFGMTGRIASALEQAHYSHKDQFREDGQPYLTEHIYPVTKMVIDFLGSRLTEDMIISSLLHDALEDDHTFTDEALQMRFGRSVHDSVKALSKPNLRSLAGLTETERRNRLNKVYFLGLSKAGYAAKVIKLIDRIDNLYWAKTFGEELVAIYIKETLEYYIPLAKTVDGTLSETMLGLLLKLKKDAGKMK